MKVAIVFDNQHRPETTGFYCRRALAKLVDVEHLLPHELALIPDGLFDLFVFVDDGLSYEIPDSLRPRASWAIDTHMDLERAIRRFGDSEHLFAAQKNGAEQLEARLGREVEWLPLACDPEIHQPVRNVERDADIVFVGHPVGQRRTELIELLSKRYPDSLFCRAIFEDMAAAYSRGRIGFNCGVADDLNMRLFEIPAHGIPLLTNHVAGNGLEELFDVGEHLLTYRDEAELMQHVDTLLTDSELRQKIAEAGLRHVTSHHTYDQRMQRLLEVAQSPQATSVAFSKAADYFEFPRPDVQALIPEDAKRILDIGCGAGALGADLKRHRDVNVTGIELNPDAAQRARGRLDHVINKSIDQVDACDIPESFDCVILADVLEHIRNPARTLGLCRNWLTDNGSIVISVPNSRHHSVISGLINGNWTYEKAGLLDEDHVRCFTRREIEKLLYRSGFTVQELRSVPGSGYQQWQHAGSPGEVSIGQLHIAGLSPAEAEEFYTYQHLLRGVPQQRPNFGLTSIVIVTWNQLAFTKECVDSILARTDELVELVFVDNGSADGTPEYLDTIPGATVIRNHENRGYAPAVNQGIRASRGDNILLLNNDCVVTTGWLDGLLESLHDDPTNGMVGPVSNNVSGEQQIPVTYSDLTSLDGFAWDRRHHRELTVTDRLVGFCLLLRRSVLDEIGELDEQFEIGCFEDDDLCRRATQAGYRLLIAQHVFVHHDGSATFRGAGFDLGQILQTNQKKYLAKWETPNAPTPQSAAVECEDATHTPAYSSHKLPNGEFLLQRKTIRLSLCMIVRDNEDTIGACLDSIYPWVDEIIIVDTGSEDRTPEICRQFGARMFEFPWCDDFSAARNVSLEPARGEWVFWMDSDDTIRQEQGRRLRELVYGLHKDDCLGYVMQVHCPSSGGQMTIVDHVKVFRNLPELRFEHRIHEQILPAIRRQNGDVSFTNIHVIHSGSDQTPEVRQRKLERDFRILKLDLEERPDHPFVLFNLGMTYEDAEEYEKAEQHLRRCIEVSTEGESHLRKTWALLINSLKGQGRVAEAIETADEALQLYPGDKELLFRRGTLHHDLGQLAEAERDYRCVIDEPASRDFQSIDPAITGHKVFHNLAIVLGEAGRTDEAVDWWKACVNDSASFAPGWLALARAYVRSNSVHLAADLLTATPQTPDLASCRAVIEALVAEAEGRILDVQRTLESAWHETGDAACLDELARILTEAGFAAQAIPALETLSEIRPDDPAILHNLGQAYHARGDSRGARSCLQKSLQIRPDAEQTRALLAVVGDSDSMTSG